MHRRLLLVPATLVAATLRRALRALAAEGGLAIGHVEPGSDGTIQVLVSVPEGAAVEPDDIKVSIGDSVLDSTAESAGTATEQVRRTTIIAFDTSNSMAQRGRLDRCARQAASTFLANVPDDVYVGIVTFDADVETAMSPTQDRDAAQAVIDNIKLATQTRLNDGVIAAVKVAGTEGQRDILVLSDGRDTSKTPETDVVKAISAAEVRVDVVALDQSGAALGPLTSMSEAGGGSVISADADALEAAFAKEAAALARQVLVTATLPDDLTSKQATVTVTALDGDEPLTATTYAVIRSASAPTGPTLPSPDIEPPVEVSRTVMYGGLAARRRSVSWCCSLACWPHRDVPRPAPRTASPPTPPAAVTSAAPSTHRTEAGPGLDQAKDAAAKVLHRNRGLEQKISARLEAAGSALKPAEWLLLHGSLILAGWPGRPPARRRKPDPDGWSASSSAGSSRGCGCAASRRSGSRPSTMDLPTPSS